MQFYVFNGWPGVPKSTTTKVTFDDKESAIRFFREMIRSEPLDAWTVLQTVPYSCVAVADYQPPRAVGHQLLLDI